MQRDRSDGPPPVVFMYAGQGSQYYQMGRELYFNNLRFRRAMQELDVLVEARLGESVLQHVYDERRGKAEPFAKTAVAHQAIFMVEYALTQVLFAAGMRPALVLGSSLGEVAAAAAAGVLSPGACVDLLAEQARLLATRCGRGGMIAVIHDAGLYEAEPALHENTTLAARSWGSHFVVSGEGPALAQAEAWLKRRDIAHQRLPVEYAYHSPSLDATKAEFRAFLSTLHYGRPTVPFVSCAAAGAVEAPGADHFWRAFRGRIEFERAVRHVEAAGDHLYLDVGPAGTLATFVKQIVPAGGGSTACLTLTPFGQNLTTMARALAAASGKQQGGT